MFAEKEFKQALQAYKEEQTKKGSNAFNALRKRHSFFTDIASKDDISKQVESFTEIISSMDRDLFANRYVVQSFILEFCRYLDKDFLFNIKNSKAFQTLKTKLKEFTGEIYSTHKKFTQNVGLNGLEHLLEDYGILLEHLDLDEEATESSADDEGGLWVGNKLW
ncbi:MAG: hypothetical protein ACE5J5_03850 [Candidatus Hydrothermarchaeales archaeon]